MKVNNFEHKSNDYWINIFRNILEVEGDITKSILEKHGIGRGVYQNRFHGSNHIKHLLGLKVLSIDLNQDSHDIVRDNVISVIKELGSSVSYKLLNDKGISESTILKLGGLASLLREAGIQSDFEIAASKKDCVFSFIIERGYLAYDIFDEFPGDAHYLNAIFEKSLKNTAKKLGVPYYSRQHFNALKISELYDVPLIGTDSAGWRATAFLAYSKTLGGSRFTFPMYANFAKDKKYFPSSLTSTSTFEQIMQSIGLGKDNISMQDRWLEFFETNFFPIIREKRFDSCRNPETGCLLSFDGFNEEHNLLIEFQDSSHYFPIKKFGGKEGLRTRLRRDSFKVKWAEENGYKLLVCNSLDGFDVNNIKLSLLKLDIKL